MFAIISGADIDVHKTNKDLKAVIVKKDKEIEQHQKIQEGFDDRVAAILRVSQKEKLAIQLKCDDTVASVKRNADLAAIAAETTSSVQIAKLRKEIAEAKLTYDLHQRDTNLEVEERVLKFKQQSLADEAVQINKVAELTADLRGALARVDAKVEVVAALEKIIQNYREDTSELIEKLPDVKLNDLKIVVEAPARADKQQQDKK